MMIIIIIIMTSNDDYDEDNCFNDDMMIPPRPEQGVPKSGEGFIDFIGQVGKISYEKNYEQK